MQKSVDTKTHYKMYKKGKTWVVAGIVSGAFALTAGMTTAQADVSATAPTDQATSLTTDQPATSTMDTVAATDQSTEDATTSEVLVTTETTNNEETDTKTPVNEDAEPTPAADSTAVAEAPGVEAPVVDVPATGTTDTDASQTAPNQATDEAASNDDVANDEDTSDTVTSNNTDTNDVNENTEAPSTPDTTGDTQPAAPTTPAPTAPVVEAPVAQTPAPVQPAPTVPETRPADIGNLAVTPISPNMMSTTVTTSAVPLVQKELAKPATKKLIQTRETADIDMWMPNKRLQKAVLVALQKLTGTGKTWNTVADITQEDMALLTKLYALGGAAGDTYIDGKTAYSLEGLQYAVNLEAILMGSDLNHSPAPYYGDIEDVTPLANLQKLTLIDLQHNRIKDVTPLANLQNVTDMRLAYNAIRDFSPLKGKPYAKNVSHTGQFILLEPQMISDSKRKGHLQIACTTIDGEVVQLTAVGAIGQPVFFDPSASGPTIHAYFTGGNPASDGQGGLTYTNIQNQKPGATEWPGSPNVTLDPLDEYYYMTGVYRPSGSGTTDFAVVQPYVISQEAGTVTVHHQDAEGNQLLPDQELPAGLVGEHYETQPATVPGYVLQKTPTNASGEYGEGNIDIVYVYEVDDMSSGGSGNGDGDENDNGNGDGNTGGGNTGDGNGNNGGGNTGGGNGDNGGTETPAPENPKPEVPGTDQDGNKPDGNGGNQSGDQNGNTGGNQGGNTNGNQSGNTGGSHGNGSHGNGTGGSTSTGNTDSAGDTVTGDLTLGGHDNGEVIQTATSNGNAGGTASPLTSSTAMDAADQQPGGSVLPQAGNQQAKVAAVWGVALLVGLLGFVGFKRKAK